MNDLSKKISIVSLIGGSSFLIYLLLKKYISSDEKSSEITIDDDVRLQALPTNNLLAQQLEDYHVKQEYKKIGNKILEIDSNKVKKTEKKDDNKIKPSTKNRKIEDGVFINDYFIRASKDKKGRLVVGKLGDKKVVYSVTGEMYLPFKLKKTWGGKFKIKDVDFYIPNEETNELSIKIIDNTDKTFFIQKVELDNLINRYKSNSKGFKFISDKADFMLTKV